MANSPFTVYGLINDDHEIFYVGFTENVEKRVSEQRRMFAGVHDLRHVMLARSETLPAARRCEKALILAISAVSDLLVNDQNHVGRFEPLPRVNRQIRLWQHIGDKHNVERLIEALRDLEQQEDKGE